MRIIARSTLVRFVQTHPECAGAVWHWERVTRHARWQTIQDIIATFPKAKSLNSDRVRFEIAGGNYRLVAAVDLTRSVVFIKFLGTHAEYDRIDALTVSQY